ncbi:MAG: hypothetical protein ACTSUE_07670 [Promethearchaeota archaeon]
MDNDYIEFLNSTVTANAETSGDNYGEEAEHGITTRYFMGNGVTLFSGRLDYQPGVTTLGNLGARGTIFSGWTHPWKMYEDQDFTARKDTKQFLIALSMSDRLVSKLGDIRISLRFTSLKINEYSPKKLLRFSGESIYMRVSVAWQTHDSLDSIPVYSWSVVNIGDAKNSKWVHKIVLRTKGSLTLGLSENNGKERTRTMNLVSSALTRNVDNTHDQINLSRDPMTYVVCYPNPILSVVQRRFHFLFAMTHDSTFRIISKLRGSDDKTYYLDGFARLVFPDFANRLLTFEFVEYIDEDFPNRHKAPTLYTLNESKNVLSSGFYPKRMRFQTLRLNTNVFLAQYNSARERFKRYFKMLLFAFRKIKDEIESPDPSFKFDVSKLKDHSDFNQKSLFPFGDGTLEEYLLELFTPIVEATQDDYVREITRRKEEMITTIPEMRRAFEENYNRRRPLYQGILSFHDIRKSVGPHPDFSDVITDNNTNTKMVFEVDGVSTVLYVLDKLAPNPLNFNTFVSPERKRQRVGNPLPVERGRREVQQQRQRANNPVLELDWQGEGDRGTPPPSDSDDNDDEESTNAKTRRTRAIKEIVDKMMGIEL